MSFGNNDDSSIREDHLSTGINILDEEVLRGVPKGSTIAVLGDADSSSEMILHSLAGTDRNTEYVSTIRPKQGIIEDIARVAKKDTETVEENVSIRDVRGSTDDFGDTVRKSSQRVEGGNLIIDTFSSRYDDSRKMLGLARRLYQQTTKDGGLTYLYFVATETSDLTRAEREILQMADGVFNVRSAMIGQDQIENNLFINKLRGVDIPSDAQNLVFGRGLTIDVTSDIG